MTLAEYKRRMAQLEDQFQDMSKRSFQAVPPGIYNCRLSSATVVEKGEAKQLTAIFDWLVMEGPEAMQTFQQNFQLEPPADQSKVFYGLSFLRRAAEALGYTWPNSPMDVMDLIEKIDQDQPAAQLQAKQGKGDWMNYTVLKRLRDEAIPDAPERQQTKAESQPPTVAPSRKKETTEADAHRPKLVKLLTDFGIVFDENATATVLLKQVRDIPWPKADLTDDEAAYLQDIGAKFASMAPEQGELEADAPEELKAEAETAPPTPAAPIPGGTQKKSKTPPVVPPPAAPKAPAPGSIEINMELAREIIRDSTDEKPRGKLTVEGVKRILDQYDIYESQLQTHKEEKVAILNALGIAIVKD